MQGKGSVLASCQRQNLFQARAEPLPYMTYPSITPKNPPKVARFRAPNETEGKVRPFFLHLGPDWDMMMVSSIEGGPIHAGRFYKGGGGHAEDQGRGL